MKLNRQASALDAKLTNIRLTSFIILGIFTKALHHGVSNQLLICRLELVIYAQYLILSLNCSDKQVIPYKGLLFWLILFNMRYDMDLRDTISPKIIVRFQFIDGRSAN